jgi:hypothetical protein
MVRDLFLLSPGGEDGRSQGQGQATTQLLRFAWICVPPRFFFLLSVDWNCHGQEQKKHHYSFMGSWAEIEIPLWARPMGYIHH